MASKLNWALMILLVGALIQLFVGWNANMITVAVVAAGLVIGGLTVMRITINGVNNSRKGHIILGSLLLGILVVFGVSASGIFAGAPSLPTASITDPGVAIQAGAQANAILKLNMKDSIGGTYAGAGIVYAYPVSDRNTLMKMIADGNTAVLAPNAMGLSGGVYSYTGYGAKIGDVVTFAGYLDGTPAAAESVSFVKTATVTGITAGSTPEWMLSNAQYVWYNYSTLAFYNQDTAVTIRTEAEGSAIEKTLTFDVFPTNNGEKFTDTGLWLEAPKANVAAFKKVTISGKDMNGVAYSIDYGMPQELPTSDNAYRAAPALTTSTNTMYYVGAIPDSIRTSTSQKALTTVKATYDHPASGIVHVYFKMTQNTQALTTSGGHFDSPSTNLDLNMTAAGTDAWT